MELLIPQWAVYLGGALIPVIIGGPIWLLLRQNEHATKIAVISSQLDGIKGSITDARVEFRVSFDKIEGRLDQFLSDEMNFLKNIKQDK